MRYKAPPPSRKRVLPDKPEGALGSLLSWCIAIFLVLAGSLASAQTVPNGGFESNNFTNWNKTTFLNPGLSGAEPYGWYSIVRTAGGSDATTVVGGPGGPFNDGVLGALVQYPAFGQYAARVNYYTNGQNGNSIWRDIVLTNAMQDLSDGRLHIRFAYLPVLDNPGHTSAQQPYFWVGASIAGGAILYDNLNFAGFSGALWRTSGNWQYTAWQLQDIVLPMSYVGQTVRVEFLAAGCSPSAHYGWLYVDGVDSAVQGLWVTAVADKTTVMPGDTITYTYTVRNTSGFDLTNVNFAAAAPPGTTLVGQTNVGPHGAMMNGASYTAYMTVSVNAGTTGTIVHDDYYTEATGVLRLYGTAVNVYSNTTIPGLSVTGVADRTLAAVGDVITYTYTITNRTGGTLNNVTMDAQAPALTTLGVKTGMGNHGDLASGASYTTTMTVTVAPGAAGYITHADYYTTATNQPLKYGGPILVGVTGPDTDLGVSLVDVAKSTVTCNRLQYEFLVKNFGPAAATHAQVAFTLPANATLVSVTPSLGTVTSYAPLTISFGDMALGATVQIFLVMDLNDTNPVTTGATVSGWFTDINAANDTVTNVFTHPAPISASLSTPVTLNYGGSVTLTANVSGGWGTPTFQWYRGPVGNSGASVALGTSSSQVVSGLAAGSYTYWVRVTDTPCTTIVDSNGCTVNALGPNTDLQAILTVAKSTTCDRLVYTLTAHNTGVYTASQVQLGFTRPVNSTYVSTTAGAPAVVTSTSPFLATLGDIIGGGSVTFTVTVALTDHNQADANLLVSGLFTDTNPANDNAFTSHVYPAALSVDPLTPTLTLPYGGSVNLSAVTSGGWGAPTYQWYRGPVGNVGGSTALGTSATQAVTGLAAGTYTYWVRVTDSVCSTSVDSTGCTVTAYGPSTDLQAIVSVAQSTTVCDQLIYTVTATNNGLQPASLVQLDFARPINSTYVSHTAGAPVVVTSTSPFTASLGNIAGGTSITFTITVNLTDHNPADATLLVSGLFTDTNPANDHAHDAYTHPAPLAIDAALPAALNVLHGTVQTITVSASGGWSPLTYQWYLGASGVTTSPVVGQTTATLTIPSGTDGTYSYWVRVTDRCGSVDSTATSVHVYSWVITSSSLGGGTISPTPTYLADAGSTPTFTLTPDPGWHAYDVLIDGVPTALTGANTYTFPALGVPGSYPGTHTIQARFATYIAVSNTHGGGTITPAGPNVEVLYGASQTFTFTPVGSGMRSRVLVDGVDMGPLESYTFTNVTAAGHTIAVTFQVLRTYTPQPGGTVSGLMTQWINYGTNATLVTAVPDAGYTFTGWSDGLGTAARTDLAVTTTAYLTANFIRNGITLTYVAGTGGSISGTTPQSLAYGANGTPVTAVPNAGYSFVNWSDGLATPTRQDLNVTASKSVTANFAAAGLVLTYNAGTGGSITGTTPQTVVYGGSGTAVTAVANANYTFLRWSDNIMTATRTDTNVTASKTVTAMFDPRTYTFTYNPGTGGSITGTRIQSVKYGLSGSTVTAVASTGYTFTGWSDGIATASRADVCTGNLTVTANFTKRTFTVEYLIQGNGEPAAPEGDVAPSAVSGPQGTISGTTTQTVAYGGTGSYVTAKANTGYTFLGWSDGYRYATRRETNVTGNKTIYAIFSGGPIAPTPK